MSKNVAVFVDVANIFYAAKAAGVDIDYVTLLRAATAGRDFVRAYAYTGLDPENENQRNFHAFLQRHGYRVVSKDIRKYGDGKVKANLDIELVVDMLKTARNLDIAVLVSGDGDFAPAVRAVQEMGVRVEVISFRGNTSSDLIEVADQFIDITQIAKVEKGSTRSGRRVAATAEEDLSMTEVPEKQTEGTGRGRGRGRGRARPAEEAPALPAASAAAEPEAGEAAAPASGRRRRAGAVPVLTLLPGEKLSGRAAALAAGTAPEATQTAGEVEVEVEATSVVAEAGSSAELTAAGTAGPGEGGEGSARRRRRRRRGGRGRGRGRAEGVEAGGFEPYGAEEEAELEPLPAPSAPRHGTFGSVWDSQIGMPRAPRTDVPIPEEDLDEPEIPEYLLAERRRAQQAGRGRGGRAGRAYAAAVERERFGRPGATPGLSRYPTPAPRSGGVAPAAGRRERPSSEPWSEVPPEIEAMLRAQLAARQRGETPTQTATEPTPPASEGPAAEAAAAETPSAGPEAPTPKRRTTRRRAMAAEGSPAGSSTASVETAEPTGSSASATEAATTPTRRRTTRRRTTSAEAAAEAGSEVAPTGETAEGATAGSGGTPARRRTTRRRATAAEGEGSSAEATEVTTASAAPRRRTTRRRSTSSEGAAEPTGEATSSDAPAD